MLQQPLGLLMLRELPAALQHLLPCKLPMSQGQDSTSSVTLDLTYMGTVQLSKEQLHSLQNFHERLLDQYKLPLQEQVS